MSVAGIELVRDAPVPTWFGVGGCADALAQPGSVDEVREVMARFTGGPVRVLGDGANLLVDDDGVDGLVLDLREMSSVDFGAESSSGSVVVRAQAGANLPKLITECVRRGLSGLEVLAGIPATVGGAVMMNAGGAFGQIGDVVERVTGMTRGGGLVELERRELSFSYRESGLEELVILEVELGLRATAEGERVGLRERLKEVMAYKKNSQPMADRSAGCFWKNPVNPAGDGRARLSAGKLIDECGLKGLSVGGATVSDRHANFVVTRSGCTARDVLELMRMVRERVRRERGIELRPEVVVWGREDRTQWRL